MKKSEISELITTHINNMRLFNYERKRCFNSRDYGVFLYRSEKLILVQNENDFMLDGFSIIRFKDISDISLKGDFYEAILQKEGLIDKKNNPQIRLESWQTVFQDLMETRNNIIIENESISDDDFEFGIGKIEKVYRNSVHIRHFDAEGRWEKYSLIIPYSKITKVTFDSRYVNVFSKYV